MKNTSNSTKKLEDEYKSKKQSVEGIENKRLDVTEEIKQIKAQVENDVKTYVQYSVENSLDNKEEKVFKRNLKLKIRNRLMKLDSTYDIFAKSRKKALKLLYSEDPNIYLSSIDMIGFTECVEKTLKNSIQEYRKGNKNVSFFDFLEKEYCSKLELLAETVIKDIRELIIQIETDVKEYVQSIADGILSATYEQKLVMKITENVVELENSYDFFVKERLGALKVINFYNKKMNFYNADTEKFFKTIKKSLEEIVENYKKEGKLYSFVAELKKRYFNGIRDAIFELLNEKNPDYKIQISVAKKEIRKLYKEILFKNDEKFLDSVIKTLNDKKTFNYFKIRYLIANNILSYIELLPENEKINNDLYDYIIKEEISKGTSEEEIKYIIESRNKQDLTDLKINISNIIDALYATDDEDKDIKSKNILKQRLSEMSSINIGRLKDTEVQMSRIVYCLYRIKNILKKRASISILKKNKDGKEYSIIEKGTLKKPSFTVAKEKLFSYMDIYDNIKDRLPKTLQDFFMYMFKYIIMEYRRRGHEDIELYDYVKNDEKFIKYYKENIPKNENPNYIENATDKKYTLVPNEKIVYKALSFITNYLNIKYDTGRKQKNKILEEVYKTIKEENTGLRYLKKLMQEDF